MGASRPQVVEHAESPHQRGQRILSGAVAPVLNNVPASRDRRCSPVSADQIASWLCVSSCSTAILTQAADEPILEKNFPACRARDGTECLAFLRRRVTCSRIVDAADREFMLDSEVKACGPAKCFERNDPGASIVAVADVRSLRDRSRRPSKTVPTRRFDLRVGLICAAAGRHRAHAQARS